MFRVGRLIMEQLTGDQLAAYVGRAQKAEALLASMRSALHTLKTSAGTDFVTRRRNGVASVEALDVNGAAFLSSNISHAVLSFYSYVTEVEEIQKLKKENEALSKAVVETRQALCEAEVRNGKGQH